MNNLFVQFYSYNKYNDAYDLFNGFSDTLDFCKSKGEMVWIHLNKMKESISMNIPRSIDTVYVSTLFDYQVRAVQKWEKKTPNVKFVVGGPAIKFSNYKDTSNVTYWKKSVEEYFKINEWDYEWKIEIPEELKEKKAKIIRYGYSIQSKCYWGKCIYCRANMDKYERKRPTHRYRNNFKKLTNAKQEIVALNCPSITSDIMKDFIIPLKIDNNMLLRCYIRPDKKTYLLFKVFIPKLKNRHKISFIIAPEFLSEKMLNYMKKGTDIKTIKKFIAFLNKNNINHDVNFILGWPNMEESDVEEFRTNLKPFNRNSPINLFLLVSSVSGSDKLSKLYPIPKGHMVWHPIREASAEVIERNIKVLRMIQNKFDVIRYHNFKSSTEIEEILYNKIVGNHEKGTIDSYSGYDKYCSIVRGKTIEEMFGEGTFYQERNAVMVDMLRSIPNPSIFEFAATYGFLARQIWDEIDFKRYTTSNFLPEVVGYMKNQLPSNIDLIQFDANRIVDGYDLSGYDTFICTSFEHLKLDRDILNLLPSGNVIFSVPNFDDPTHFRTFKDENEVLHRYADLIDIERIEVIQKEHMKKFIVQGRK